MLVNQPQNVQVLESGPLDAVYLPGYRLVSKLGAGGFGTVFQAVQESTGQTVALKMLRPGADLDERRQQRQIERFERETQLCAELSHPHIVQLLDKGKTEDGQLFAVFEFVQGETLKDLLVRRGPLSALEAGGLMGQVLDALASAHARGVVHRDLKPHNIMVSHTGARAHAKVLDFGIGALIPDQRQADYKTLTMTEEVMGTPSYSAPEQLRGEPPTIKSDLYAWGLVFLECLTGQPVMQGRTLAEIYHQQLSPVDVVLPSAIAGHELAHLLRRTLRKDSRDRAEHASQVYADFCRLNLASLVGDLTPSLGTDDQNSARMTVTLQHDGFGHAFQSERRQITVLCCNVSLKLDGEVEPDFETMESLETLQRDQLALIVDVALKYGGYAVGELGGSVMIYYGYPHVSDADARRAARTALELIDLARRRNAQSEVERGPRMEYRLGMHTGMVLTRPDRAPAGWTPALAFRLEHLAPPETVLVSAATRQLLEPHLTFEPAEPELVRRHQMPSPVFVLTGERHTESRPFLRGARSERPLVGRQLEDEAMRRMWAAARQGEGGSVLMTGEPGIGKSRLADEVRCFASDEGFTILDCRCLPEHQNNALYPVLEMLKRRLRFPDADSSNIAIEQLHAALQPCEWPIEITMPILCAWLSLPIPSHFSPVQYSPNRQKQILLEVLEQLLFSWADGQPCVLIVEDLHWIDLITMEWLDRLVKAASSRAFLLLLTARPEFSVPWAPEQLQILPLQRLASDQAKVMIQQVLDGQPIADDALTRLSERVDGIPLFVEELIRMLLDRDALIHRDGVYVLSERFDEASIPITLRDMLNERLDNLGPAKETAQMAAAIGREFDYGLLVHASFRSEARVQADLDQLIAADLTYRQLHVQCDRFMFRHALIRDAAYEGMPQSIREQAHASIAETLESRFQDVVEATPAVIADHLAGARQFGKAVEYGMRAARSSLQRSLNDETLFHTGQVEAWLEQIEPDVQPEAELEISGILTQALMGKFGWADPQVEASALRTREKLNQLPNSPYTVSTLWSLATYHQVAGNRAAVRTITDELVETAEISGDVGLKAAAAAMLGIRYRADGQYAESATALERALQLYDPQQHRTYGMEFGLDIRTWATGTLGIVRWFTGESADAVRYVNDAFAWAQHLNHVPSLGIALLYRALLQQHRGAREAAREAADKLLQLAEKYGLPAYSAYGKVIHCWATDNAPLALDILDGLQGIGCRLGLPFYTSLVADAEARSGLLEAAIQRIDHCLALCRENDERNYEPELYRRRALYLLEAHPSGHTAIERDLERAAALSRDNGMRRTEAEALCSLLELFADTSGQRAHRLRDLISQCPDMAALGCEVTL